MYTPGIGWGPTNLWAGYDGITGRAIWITIGMTLGSIMWFNVWFVIWPTQKMILGGKATPETLPALRKRAALFSKINTYLSGPMLFSMLAAPHYGSINIVTFLVFTAIAVIAVVTAYKHSTFVGKSV
jgi:uncharacterized membrane protein